MRANRSPSPLAAPRLGTLADVPAVVTLHADRIAEGFLVTLGPRFLTRLYRRVVRFAGSFLIVAAEADGVSGFVAVAEHTGRLYREFLVHDGVTAAVVAAPAVLRAPTAVWETFRYGTAADDADLPQAEILSVAVKPGARGNGLGGRLVAAALDELRRRGIGTARVVTATENAAALRMYERAGFRRRRRTEVHRGISQEVLVWP